MDFNTLIGLDAEEAKIILKQNNFNNIEVKINAKEDDKCNTTLVCAVKQEGNCITLICGNFYFLTN